MESEPLGPIASGRTALAEIKQQLRTRAPLDAVADLGSQTLLLSAENSPTPEELGSLLRYVWQHTDLVRLRFRRAATLPQQLTAPWEEK